METMFRIALVVPALAGMLLADVPLLHLQLVPEAHAILGVRRRTAVVAYSAGAATGSAAAQSQQAAASQQQAVAQQQSATAQQQSATAQQQAAAAQQQSMTAQQQAAAAAAGTPLPVGAVVSTLPAGCTPKVVGGVEYHACGSNFYRAAFQGNTLVYVTAQP
jgi:hypothetical protein